MCRCFTASWGKVCAAALVAAPPSRMGTISLLAVFYVPWGLLDARGMLCAYRGPAQRRAGGRAARPAEHTTLRARQSPALQRSISRRWLPPRSGLGAAVWVHPSCPLRTARRARDTHPPAARQERRCPRR